MAGLLARERIIAPPDYNRWRVPLASVAIHLCIGSVYAWSIYNPPLTKVFGVVTSAADDWNLRQVVWIFTVAIVFLGLAAAVAGRWLETVGPRMVGTVAACCWGGGYIVGAAGILTHQLWLIYLGYGVIGGCGLGLGYVSPVSTLIRWFPDRRGMAAGMAIMGFGGGAMIGAPMKEYFLKMFYRAPDYHPPTDTVPLVTEAGRRFAEVAGVLQEVVVAGAADVRGMTVPGPEGVYVVGTGATGIAETFIAIGAIYLVVMLLAAFSYRLPAPGWKPAGWEPPPEDAQHHLISRHDVDIDQAHRNFRYDIAACRRHGVCSNLCRNDQRVQHDWPFLLGKQFRLHRAPQYLLDIFRIGDTALPVSAVHGTAGQCQPGSGLARLFLCGNDDHLHNVWRRFRDHSGLSSRHLRHKICGRHPRATADRLEHGRRPRPPGNHIFARELGQPGDTGPDDKD
jgi:hypothetical protein